jgi:hypothetical protein
MEQSNQKDISKWVICSPEKQTENWEWADVDPASTESAKNSSQKSGDQKHGALPSPEVGNRVVGLSFVLP